MYVEPQPLAPVSDHKTLELETIKLASEIDPRKLPTQLSLPRPPSVAPPPDSIVQPELAVASTQPPAGPSRRWRTPLALALVLAALLVLVLARRAAMNSSGVGEAANAAPAPSAAEPSDLAPQAKGPPSPAPPVAAPPVADPPSPVEVVPAPTPPDLAPSAALAPSEPEPSRAPRHPQSVRSILKSKVPSDASARAFVVSDPNQPKRAIY